MQEEGKRELGRSHSSIGMTCKMHKERNIGFLAFWWQHNYFAIVLPRQVEWVFSTGWTWNWRRATCSENREKPCSPEMLGDGIFNVVHRGQWQHFWKERVLQKTWSDWINAFILKRRMMAETAANSVRLLIKVSRDTLRPSLRCGEPWCMQRFTKCFSKPRSSKREKKPPVCLFCSSLQDF